MSHQVVTVSYNKKLGALEKLLAGVRRTGEFFVRGAIELPMPKVEIEGVGVLSFAIPDGQSRKLIEQAERAPYGREPQTVLDTSVRRLPVPRHD
jgi:hypothetical protein